MFVKSGLHRKLFGLDPAIFLSVVFVDELHGEDGVIGVEGGCFLDTMVLSAVVEPEESVCEQASYTMRMRQSQSFLTRAGKGLELVVVRVANAELWQSCFVERMYCAPVTSAKRNLDVLESDRSPVVPEP